MSTRFVSYMRKVCAMGRKERIEESTIQLVTPIVEEQGYELVDVEYTKDKEDTHLIVYLDREGGIDLNAITEITAPISEALDQKDLIAGAYILEVSSPDLSRPFKRPRDFEKNLGKDVEFKLYQPFQFEMDGKKYSDKEFVGILKGYQQDQEQVTIGFTDTEEYQFSLKDLVWIRSYIEF